MRAATDRARHMALLKGKFEDLNRRDADRQRRLDCALTHELQMQLEHSALQVRGNAVDVCFAHTHAGLHRRILRHAVAGKALVQD